MSPRVRARQALAGFTFSVIGALALGGFAGWLGNPGHDVVAHYDHHTIVELGRCLEVLPHCHVEVKANGDQEVIGSR
jgi:hypothetical protein